MTEHYFTEKPAAVFKREQFRDTLLGNELIINSGSGIFSYKSVDFGSRLLIENAKIPNVANGRLSLLDLGCGYGVIGMAIKRANPSIIVTMCDINERAIRIANENVKHNNLDIEVLKSDMFSNPNLHERKFDVILTNPPFSAGKEVCKAFIRQSHDHLKHNGLFQLVAPHNKGGESLKKYMLEVFGNAGDTVKKAGFRVYISIRK